MRSGLILLLGISIVPGAAPYTIDVVEEAKLVADKLRKLPYLSFELVVTETVEKNGVITQPPAEVARALVKMAPGKFRTEVYHGDEQRLVMIGNGDRVTEWNQDVWTTYHTPPFLKGNAYLDAGMDCCYVGSCTEGWLGPDAHRAEFFETKISQAKVVGNGEVEGIPCRRFIWEKTWSPDEWSADGTGEGFRVIHLFSVGSNHFVRKWMTTQITFKKPSDSMSKEEVVLKITRSRVYKNIKTIELPPDVFTERPPQELERRYLSKR